MQLNRDLQGVLERLDVIRRLLGEHRTGGVHDGDAVNARVLQHSGLLRERGGGENVTGIEGEWENFVGGA